MNESSLNIAGFLSGKYLTHLDLPLPIQVWTISEADQQLVGTDKKICLTFAEFPDKPFGCNKTNLRRLADLYGLDAGAWPGKQLQVYRSTTTYGGKVMQCIRVCGPGQVTPEAVCDTQGAVVHPNAIARTAPAQQPVAAPVQQQAAPVQQQPVATPIQQPVEAPQPQQPVAAQTPWEQDLANQQNSPPSE